MVTGGAGFIGSHVADAYIERGHEVVIIDDFSTGVRANVHPKAALYPLDILDPSIPNLLAEISPDVVNHHAAQKDLRRSVVDPLLDARINIIGLLWLLEGCRGAGVKKVIFASSGGAVYGEQGEFPAPECHPKRPASPYGVSKLTGEHYLSYYYETYGISYVALRYSNVYGPRQSSAGEAGVVAIFVQKILRGEAPIINGDGKQTRDYVYVDDVVSANLAALEYRAAGAMNIGTGREVDILTVCRLIRDKMGTGKKATHGPLKAGEQRRSSLDCALARERLGWSPRVTLSEGLDMTIGSFQERQNQ